MHLDWLKYLAFSDLLEQSQNVNTMRKLGAHLEEAAYSPFLLLLMVNQEEKRDGGKAANNEATFDGIDTFSSSRLQLIYSLPRTYKLKPKVVIGRPLARASK